VALQDLTPALREVWLAVEGTALIGFAAAITDTVAWAELTDPDEDED
jgi:hypothetical protein